MFNISDKVVCVDDVFRVFSEHPCITTPKKGVIYVVRGFEIAGPRVGLLLVGINNPLHPNGGEYAFDQRRFRKLSDIKAENALGERATHRNPEQLYRAYATE